MKYQLLGIIEFELNCGLIRGNLRRREKEDNLAIDRRLLFILVVNWTGHFKLINGENPEANHR